MNKNVIQFPLFVSSESHCQAEFKYYRKQSNCIRMEKPEGVNLIYSTASDTSCYINHVPVKTLLKFKS